VDRTPPRRVIVPVEEISSSAFSGDFRLASISFPLRQEIIGAIGAETGHEPLFLEAA